MAGPVNDRKKYKEQPVSREFVQSYNVQRFSMIFWIRRSAMILSVTCFFIVLFISINPADPLNLYVLVPALAKAFFSAALFWFAGYVAGDILFKGLLTDITSSNDDLFEGGIVQRVHEQKKQMEPGGSEMPFEGTVTNERSSEK
jgi:hypothetical protein